MSRRAAVLSLVLLLAFLLVPIGLYKQEDGPVMSGEIPERSAEPISEYDPIIHQVADSLDMDWHLIAAIIYHESRFHNTANSHKGAVGLMQILSKRYSQEYLMVPRNNITVGSRYIKKLQKMYSPVAANQLEALKFALAGYNYGENKVWALIEKTREEGEDSSRWDVVSKHLPDKHHTVIYVNKVLDTYAYYYRKY